MTNLGPRSYAPPYELSADGALDASPSRDDTVDYNPVEDEPSNSTSNDAPAVASLNGNEDKSRSTYVPSAVATNENSQTFPSVLASMQPRQNSVDSESVVSSQASEASPSSLTQGPTGQEVSTNEIMEDEQALEPDKGQEVHFQVDNNPFAFSPGQLGKLLNPKSLSAFYAIGGLSGLEKGVQSDRKAGLSVDEGSVTSAVSFYEATNHKPRWAAGEPKSHIQSPGHTDHPSSGDNGFNDRKRVFKDNRLPEKKGKSLLQLMWITYQDKVLMLLTAAAVVSLAIGIYQSVGIEHKAGEAKVEWVEGVAIVVAILIVVFVGSINDYSKERQFAKLNRKKQDRLIKVVRSGKTIELSVFELLVGDVVHLEPGDLVPVDGLLIEGFDVKCDESQATGESDVIKKQPADDVFNAIENRGDLKGLDPFVLSGARIMEGAGTFMVTATGVHSTYGQTLMALNEDTEVTPLQSKLNIVAEYIAKLGGAAGLLLFVVLFIEYLIDLPRLSADTTPTEKGRLFIEIFIVVVTIIVVAVPEGLPLAVTLALAFATTRMLKDNNLVRHLKACEVMGNATNICSDKTGTLTQNKMQVVAGTVGTSHQFGSQRVASDTQNTGQDSSIADFVKHLNPEVKKTLLQSIAVNSTAFEGDVDGNKSFIGSKTETALLLLARDHLGMGSVSEERESVHTLHLFPFDSGRKCMGIVIQQPNGRARLHVKGASEIVLDQCTHLLKDASSGEDIASLAQEDRERITSLINTYASRSLRTIGIAYRDFERWPSLNPRRKDDEKVEIQFEDIVRNMTFIGVVGIQDPLREGVPEAVRTCQKAGVCVRMVTGDNKITAQAIASECGILQPNSIVMEGPEFRNLTKREQDDIIPRLHVLARSSPEDKRILVKRLKEKGEIVAVTGDGTNDAPALKMADVGFSMGISGTEVAKEASAIILMDDNFNSIVKALMWGRAVNDAVKRFLQFQLTVNLTAVVLTFVTAVSSQEPVLNAVQLLWVNLIMDTLAALALATDPPQKSVLKRLPERRDASIISTTMWKMIIGQAAYQLTVTFLLFYASPGILPRGNELGLGPEALRGQVRTLVFNTFVWMQIFNQWNNRRLDNKFNVLEGITKNYFFMAISCIMMGGQILIIFVGGPAFKVSQHKQTPTQWATAVVLGSTSIPIGMIIRLIPNEFLEYLVPDFLTKKVRERERGGFIVDEEQLESYPRLVADVREDLAFLKRIRGGRLNNLKFAVRHPRESFAAHLRTPVQPRPVSASVSSPPLPASHTSSMRQTVVPAPRRSSRSKRNRSSSVGATAVMAGLIAAGITANWDPPELLESRGAATDGDKHDQGPGSTPATKTDKPRQQQGQLRYPGTRVVSVV